MQESPGFALPSTTLLVEVSVAPELAEIHDEYAPLLRLSGLCTPHSSVSAAVSSGVSASNFSGDDDEEPRGRRSPAMASPVRAAESKLAELVAPVVVTLPPPMSDEDANFIAHYVRSFRAREEAERQYVAFIFDEYRKRKSVEQKWGTGVEAMAAQLAVLRQRELPPEVRAAVQRLERAEAVARESVWAAYAKFLEWIGHSTPQWIEAAQRQEQERLANERAKKAAMAAAREALAQELALGKQLSGGGGGAAAAAASSGGHGSGGPSRPAPLTAAAVNADGTLSYEPALSLDPSVADTPDSPASVSASELRRKAIRMLEAEEEGMKRRREEQLRLLKAQEEQLLAEMALKKQREAEAAERQAQAAAREQEDALAKRYEALLEQEHTLQSRLRAKEEEKARQEAERRMMLEHVAAEEQLLRQRLQEKEDRRKASEEEAARVARERKMREVREQEEALRRRIAEREAAAEAEREAQAAKARREAEEAAVRAQQEERLRQLHEEQDRAEKARQLAYLRDQEEAYKRHLREKELAAIEERRRATEAQWTHPSLPPPTPQQGSTHSLSMVSPSMPAGSMAMATPHAAPYPPTPPASYYPPAPQPAPPQPPVPTYYNPYAAPMQPYVQPAPYAAPYPAVPAPQPPMMVQGYPPAVNPYYAQPAQPPMMAAMQPSPYAPAAYYPR